MAKCLMLDVDGVLVAGRPQDGLPWTQTLETDLGIAPDALVAGFFATEWRAVITGQRDLRPALTAALAEMGVGINVDTLIAYWFGMDAGIVAPVLEDCRALRAQGIPVFLTTNQEHLRAAYLMDDMGLAGDVDGIIYSAQVGATKPDAAFFAQAALVAGYAPHDLILVDDTQANVIGARAAGWAAVQWQTGMRLVDCVPH